MNARSYQTICLTLALSAAFLPGCRGATTAGPTHDSGPLPTVRTIADVQGSGTESPFEGQRVTVEGVVTGDFQDGDADISRDLGGFYLQMAVGDSDPGTSDGIFVFDGNSNTPDVDVGHILRVSGKVVERFGETQVVADVAKVIGTGSVEAIPLEFPRDTVSNSDGILIADLERVEGMLVRVDGPLAVSGLNSLARFGEVTLAAGGRLRQFTNSSDGNVAEYTAHRERSAARRMVLDDGLSRQNPRINRYFKPFASSRRDRLRNGDSARHIVGNVRFSRGSGAAGIESFRLEPVNDVSFDSVNPPPQTPPAVGGNIVVASLNLLNYFTTIDDGNNRCGPASDAGCRGADSERELSRQRQKIVTALSHLGADIVGLMEIENNDGEAVASLADALNEAESGNRWRAVRTGSLGDDTIAVAILYNDDTVTPAGRFAVLTAAVDREFDDGKNRPALAQSFVSVGSGGRFTVVVNHLKSKGSPCNDVGDPNRNDGQGNCNRTRTRAAAALVRWLQTDPTESNDPDVLIIGDLNAYLQEDPLRELEQAGYVNLLREFAGSDAYSFVFDSQAGALDHALASSSMLPQIKGAAEWHINADEASLIDYNLEFGRDADIFDPEIPFRVSDHDPVIVGFDP